MRLLCADDDPDIRTILGLALGLDPAIQAQVCNGGAELLAAVRQSGADAILLDVQMPDPDGFATCAQLKADPATAHLPVVFLSASSSDAIIARIRASGAAGHLEKPFDPVTLASAVRALIQ